MVLASRDAVVPLLICPRCRSGLRRDADGLGCTDPACPYAARGSFPIIGDWVVVVDIARSVVDPAALSAERVTVAPNRSALDRLPASLRRLWKPPNLVAQSNIERLLALLPPGRRRVLVVGGGSVGNGMDPLYATGPDIEVIGFDLYGSAVTQLVSDAHAIPLATGSVDAVVVQAVLEHVLEPATVVAEIHRVLTDDGLLYAETPFLQQVHAGPYDFTRFTASGHRYLLRAFDEIDAGVTAGPGTQLLWSLDHLVRGLTRSRTAGRMVRAALFWLRALDRVVDDAAAQDGACALYFLGRRSGAEVSPREIIAYYRR